MRGVCIKIIDSLLALLKEDFPMRLRFLLIHEAPSGQEHSPRIYLMKKLSLSYIYAALEHLKKDSPAHALGFLRATLMHD